MAETKNGGPGEKWIRLVRVLNQNVSTSCSHYEEWKSNFIYIHGELDTQRKIDLKKIESAFEITIVDSNTLFHFIFSLETCYSIILRFLAHKSIFGERKFSLDIFDDNLYANNGVLNYTCANYYNWFLQLPNISDALSDLYDDVKLQSFIDKGDAVSTLFETIFPKEIRHSLGEYYTPYWLANYVIDQLVYDDSKACEKTYIDPSCGSATFIVALINKFKTTSNNAIFSHVCGIDINPLAVLAARTNYLILYCQEFGISSYNQITIPIYCADTIAINDVSPLLFPDSNNYDNVPSQSYDYIVGNPPWVNWEYLPESYRFNHANLWQYYGLFCQKGLNANFIKEDISVLLTYVAIDKYLANGGKIGFVVKESLFKSIKQGEGFRRFKIIPNNVDLKVIKVDDLTMIKPFKGAVTRTAVIYLEKGKATHYPVDYVVWQPKTKIVSFQSDYLFDLSDYIEFNYLKASPSVKTKINSGWITESNEEEKISRHTLGNNNLIARTGVFTGGANGVYWLNICSANDDTLVVSNITERAKNKMKQVQMEIEKKFVFPLLTGNDLGFWSYSYSKYILCPHTKETKMYPVSKDILSHYPLTGKYFLCFRKELEDRKGFTSMDEPIHNQYFYALQRIGSYTFAKYKVCWRYICKTFTPAVVEYTYDEYLGETNIIGNEKIISIGVDDRDEAYYICAVLSSTPYRKTIENYMIGTQITPGVIEKLNIPEYNAQNAHHVILSNLCREGHSCQGDKTPFVAKIDQIIKCDFGIVD